MTESEGGWERDSALEALTSLSEVATSSADGLNAFREELLIIQDRRKLGWSWRRIASADGVLEPLSQATSILAELGPAIGEFRRELTRALLDEGMKITEIANLLEVSRQRVSTLIGSKRSP